VSFLVSFVQLHKADVYVLILSFKLKFVKMASLFTSSEYIDIVLVYGEASRVLPESREFPCNFL
jgi:hypothetical protein